MPAIEGMTFPDYVFAAYPEYVVRSDGVAREVSSAEEKAAFLAETSETASEPPAEQAVAEGAAPEDEA